MVLETSYGMCGGRVSLGDPGAEQVKVVEAAGGAACLGDGRPPGIRRVPGWVAAGKVHCHPRNRFLA